MRVQRFSFNGGVTFHGEVTDMRPYETLLIKWNSDGGGPKELEGKEILIELGDSLMISGDTSILVMKNK